MIEPFDGNWASEFIYGQVSPLFIPISLFLLLILLRPICTLSRITTWFGVPSSKMNQYRFQGESNFPLYAQPGELSKLPPELRFQIWKYVFEDIFEKPSSIPSALSILHCNRSLYQETSLILYEFHILGLQIEISTSIDGER